MKYYCKSSLSWGEDGTGDNIQIPNPLPEVSEDWFEEVWIIIKLIRLDEFWISL